MKFPHTGKVEIIYHPVIKIPKPSDEKDEERILIEFTKKLEEIISSNL